MAPTESVYPLRSVAASIGFLLISAAANGGNGSKTDNRMACQSIRVVGSEPWVATPTRRQPCAPEQEIDQLVFAPHGIAAEEIKIIEDGKG
jgi:hypothetical protein